MNATDILRELEMFAHETFTPIIKPESWQILKKILLAQQPKHILEIGTAIGYSTIYILDTLPSAQIVSLEIRHCRYEQAKVNLAKVGYSNRSKLLLEDAYEYLENTKESFDFIFLDGAKGQYARMLPYLTRVLAPRGTIFADNLNYDGRVATAMSQGIDAIPRKHRAAVKGLISYRKEITQAPFSSIFFDMGDGIAVTTKE